LRQKMTFTVPRATLDTITPSQARAPPVRMAARSHGSSLIADSSTEEIATVAPRPQHARRLPRHARHPFASPAVHSTQTAHSTLACSVRFVAMETGGARVLVAADGVGQESEVLATEDIGPESEEVAAEDVVDPLLSVDSDPLLPVALNSQEPDEVIVLLAADDVVPDS